MFACIHSKSIPQDVSLAEFAYAFSPLVEETDGHTVVLDVEGCELLLVRLMNWGMRSSVEQQGAARSAGSVAGPMLPSLPIPMRRYSRPDHSKA